MKYYSKYGLSILKFSPYKSTGSEFDLNLGNLVEPDAMVIFSHVILSSKEREISKMFRFMDTEAIQLANICRQVFKRLYCHLV